MGPLIRNNTGAKGMGARDEGLLKENRRRYSTGWYSRFSPKTPAARQSPSSTSRGFQGQIPVRSCDRSWLSEPEIQFLRTLRDKRKRIWKRWKGPGC